jgi:uncharacterized protein YgiM (DUF1202 family)
LTRKEIVMFGASTKPRRVLGLSAACLLVAVLVFAPVASAQWYPLGLTTQLYGASGGVVGTATLISSWNGITIEFQVSGFDPIGGNRRVAIRQGGACCAPQFSCGGPEIAALPPIQLYPDGSGTYKTVTNAVAYSQLVSTAGSVLVIYADIYPWSDVIACGVIYPGGVYPPLPTPVPTTWPAPAPVPGPAATVRASALNLRQGPSLSDRVILTLSNGETVYHLGGSPVYAQGITWVWVRAYRGGLAYDGFVSSAYLSTYAPPPPPTPAPGYQVRVTATAGLRLRSGPGTNYAIRRIVPHGTVLRSSGVRQWGSGMEWTQVYIDGVTLWAASQYLQAF